MKVTALALLALFGALGVALGMGYGGYQYITPGYGQSGYNDNSFLMLIGFLFLFLILFNSNLFNTTTTSTSTTSTSNGVTVISG